MGFKEDLLEIIRAAKEKKNREAREQREFQAAWAKLRSGLILPILEEASGALNEEQVGGKATVSNGSAILWAALQADGTYAYSLSFSASRGERGESVVVVGSSVKEARDEPFSWDSITDEFVENKVTWLVKAAMQGAENKPDSAGGSDAEKYFT